MVEPDKRQIKYLKTLCHNLKPVVLLGQKGLHDSVIEEIDQALDYHELVKVRINADRESRKQIVIEICEKTKALKVQFIGQMVSLFRRNPDQPKIRFP